MFKIFSQNKLLILIKSHNSKKNWKINDGTAIGYLKCQVPIIIFYGKRKFIASTLYKLLATFAIITAYK